MKWFEHQADSSENKKIRRIEIWGSALNAEFGAMAATGWYWRLHEKVATHGVMFRLPEDYGLDLLAADLRTTIEQTTSFLNFLAEINAIDKTIWGKKKLIFCPKLAERADRYTEDLIKKEINEYNEYEETDSPIPISYELYEVIRALSEHIDPRKRTLYRDTLSRFCAEDVQSIPVTRQHKTTPHKTRRSASPSPPGGGNGDARPPLVFSSKHFQVDQELFDSLCKDYRGLPPERIKREIAKGSDWLTDNPGRHKRSGKTGFIKNTRSFLRNWLDKVDIIPSGPPPPPQGRTYESRKCPLGKCNGSGLRKAEPGEESINGMVRCECSLQGDAPKAH